MHFLKCLYELKALQPKESQPHRPCQWWSPALQELKRKRNKAQAKGDTARYKTLGRAFRRQFRAAQKDYESKRLKALAAARNPWPILRRILPGLSTSKGSKRGMDWQERELLANRLASRFNETMYDEDTSPEDLDAYKLPHPKPQTLEYWELEVALNTVNIESTGGLDGITFLHLRRLCEDPTFY